MVVGYAVAFHGHSRYTKDIDVWIQSQPGNTQLLLDALTDFGFGGLGIIIEDFLKEDQIIQLGYPPHRIDLLTSIPGVEFDDCYASRVETNIDGILISFIDLGNLRSTKLASGRLQDLADLENLT